MMRSAVRTGVVDFLLAVGEIPAKAAGYFRHVDRQGSRVDGEDAADNLTKICALLPARTGHDFSGYKDRTVVRRVPRRRQALTIDDVPAFLERLRKAPAQVQA